MDKKSVNLLPVYYQTDKNKKFLSSTIDQLIQTPNIERLNAFIGSKLSPNFKPKKDTYVTDSTSLRNSYQLLPGLIIKNLDDSIAKAYGYDDLINQLSFYGSNTDNLDKLFRSDFYSYDPKIDWDKFVNYSQYYWIPSGPAPVLITGKKKEVTSTYTVTNSDDGNHFVFTPDGLTPDPTITLYRGVSYIFNVDSEYPLYIKTGREPGIDDLYNIDIKNNGIKKGQIIVIVTSTTPKTLFYNTNIGEVAGGQINIKSITENSYIDVDAEIVGKKYYMSTNGIDLINGLLVSFGGDVYPSSYAEKEFVVEGVGDAITLTEFAKLKTPESIATQYDDDFDAEPFDDYPFDDFQTVPLIPEYITINRASRDLNSWSRYNRWFSINVLTVSANANGVALEIPSSKQAKRPIIEFKPNIQLFNHGSVGITPVDYIDNVVTDAFSIVENGSGHWVDGALLEEGDRVIFNADTDPLVRGRIFKVQFINITFKSNDPFRTSGQYITLTATDDSIPEVDSSVVINKGTSLKGTTWRYTQDGRLNTWVEAQQHTIRNQAPLFDVVDSSGNSFASSYYNGNFLGNKIFGYAEGTVYDPILGLYLSYTSAEVESTFLFQSYYMTDSFINVVSNVSISVPIRSGYLVQNNITGTRYINVWTQAEEYKLGVQQFQVVYDNTASIEITAFDNPGYISDLSLDLFVNDTKYSKSAYSITTSTTGTAYVNFATIPASVNGNKILLKLFTDTAAKNNGLYEPPINLTNNPLNESIGQFTLSEVVDHVKTMTERDPDFYGEFPGPSNLSSLADISKYGSRFIINKNSLAFAQYFISNQEHSLVNAIKIVGDDYNQFKMNFLKSLADIPSSYLPADAVDSILTTLNENKNTSFPYLLSDMVPYGTDKKIRKYTVTDPRNTIYPLTSVFDITTPSNKAVLIYLNGTQIYQGIDYTFDSIDALINISIPLVKGDLILINEYLDTDGCYIAPTPTKLGLYPKFKPEIYLDTTYADGPKKVIQGHDGSILIAFDDYRDDIVLEFENRIFNNLKVMYNPDLFDINSIIPGRYRDNLYSYNNTYNLIQDIFIRWTSTYGVDYDSNSTYDINNHKTYNYKSAVDYINGGSFLGSWRSIFKYYFDTDRPDTHPWEMLGFNIKPDWWDSYYGPAPYTSGNQKLWDDLEAGNIAQGPTAGVNLIYARPGLSTVIPVDDNGNLLDIRNWAGIGLNDSIESSNQPWTFGDIGPAEAAWRRSSNYPFALQVLLALAKPVDYANKLFDTSRMMLNLVGQYTYSQTNEFISPYNVLLQGDTNNGVIIRSAGYSVFVLEVGQKRQNNYVEHLKEQLANGDFNLFYKVGGFVNQNKLNIIVDSYNLATQNPLPFLPNENYKIYFNTSNPVLSIGISGVIVIKNNGTFIIRGYDKKNLYFTVFDAVHSSTDPAFTVGGKTESFLTWTAGQAYQAGQLVYYQNGYYRVVTNHVASSIFNAAYYYLLNTLPTVGGTTVTTPKTFNSVPKQVVYGTVLNSVQEVYDFLLGYGQWLENQGFVFDSFNTDFNTVLNWKFSAEEFIYWSMQNWANNSVITLSPFADNIRFIFNEGVVDNVLDSFYDYAVYGADGTPVPFNDLTLTRSDGTIAIKSNIDNQGIFYARLNLVQKEHALVFDNKTVFGDIIYDKQSGYRQLRMKFQGFKTSSWHGDFFSPGFLYDNVVIQQWAPYKTYMPADVVRYVGKYYSAISKITGSEKFDFAKWYLLPEEPTAQLIPNFDYKINQFEDFYSLDIDNFDSAQEKMAQHLTGYSPRPYLDNIFTNATAQYKFYQGYIKEKGTVNSISKLEKAASANMLGTVDLYEEWAFREGSFGSYSSYNEIEFPLKESDFLENNQYIELVSTLPAENNTLISHIQPSDMLIRPADFISSQTFVTVTGTTFVNNLILPYAGYVRLDDVEHTFTSTSALLTVDNSNFNNGDKIWIGFDYADDWNVYRYTHLNTFITKAESLGDSIVFTTRLPHGLRRGEYISVSGFSPSIDAFYKISDIPTQDSFSVISSNYVPSNIASQGIVYKLISSRFNIVDDIANIPFATTVFPGEMFWVDDDGTGKWAAYKKEDIYTDKILPPFVQKSNEEFGYRIAKRATSSTVFISAANYYDRTRTYGSVFVYDVDPITGVLSEIYNYGLDTAEDQWRPEQDTSPFGTAMFYDDIDDVIYVSAPDASTATTITNDGKTLLASTSSGIVKISGIYRKGIKAEVTYAALYNPVTPATYSRFGKSIFVQSALKNKLAFIGAPGVINTGAHSGTVFLFNITVDPNPSFSNYSGITTTFYKDISGTTVTGSGALATFNIITVTGISTATYNLSIINSGTSYLAGISQIKIPGTVVGGATPANDITVTVATVNAQGSILTFTQTATTYIGSTATFNIVSKDREYIVTLVNSGTNYTTNSIITIAGDRLGGLAPANDLEIAIDSVNAAGSIVTYSNTTSVTSYKLFNISQAGTLKRPGQVKKWSEFGYKITGSKDASIIAVSAPNVNTGTGAVFVYTGTNGNYSFIQSIDPTTSTTVRSQYKNAIHYGDRLGDEIVINDSGTHLFVASPNMHDGVTRRGKVGVYKWNGGSFDFLQLIDNPSISDVNFGTSISVTPAADSLVITGQGNPFLLGITFDDGNTTFDNLSCRFGEVIEQSGSAYLYERYNEKFIFVQELINPSIDEGGLYGVSSAIDDSTVYIGETKSTTPADGSVHIWKKDPTITSYQSYRFQEPLVDVNLIDKSFTLDTLKQEVVDYMDILDPIKGRITGLADQELTFKTPFDPAVYNNGPETAVVDITKYWEDDYLGELWWDLSKVKYVWYEQGDAIYRKNSWGKKFPGSTIDVYEWVKTTYSPTQWSSLTGSNTGLTLGISGTPKDLETYSSKQEYDSGTGQFITFYYYWVKNKTTVPGGVGRRISAAETAAIINDPANYGLEYISITSPNSVSVTNYKSKLIGDRINLNLAYSDLVSSINKHTEWVLIQENNRESLPTPALVQKLFDSLIGHDASGNLVPDPSLSPRQAYGIEIRPRQSMFVSRVNALRNLISFTNLKLMDLRTTGFVNFHNLNLKEEIPNEVLGEYDQIVEDKLVLDSIVTKNFIKAEVACDITDGKITAVRIINPGFGYLIPPTITVGDGLSSAKLKTSIDEYGSIVYIEITNRGFGFIQAPVLSVRPYTVICRIDPGYNNKWSKFEWTGNAWLRSHTQIFDTTQYWSYVDWKSNDFNKSKSISYAVDYPYQLQELDLISGDYVKVQNVGDGNYAVLRKTQPGVLGTFDVDFDIIYSQNGTIQILDVLWNSVNSPYSFDEVSPFDQTLYDQTPDRELKNILTAIKEDIFIGENLLYWNQFFFTAIKYALTEQHSLDWVFKTSFINVINQAGVLDQRTNYRFQDPNWYNDYIKEVKPYHTQIRNYQVNYKIGETNDTPWDLSLTFASDFDLPSYFDQAVNTFTVVTSNSSLMSQYPYKSWNDNYKYYVSDITIENPGSGYTVVPQIHVVAAPYDTGDGATAQAYISNGSISFIKVTNPGQGYTMHPDIVIVGGGDTKATTATAYARLSNDLIRSTNVRMKFDRITTATEVGSTIAVTTATADGVSRTYNLQWAASPIKTDTLITLDNRLVLKSDYTVTNHTAVFSGFGTQYTKQYSKITFNFIPPVDQVINVKYKKNIELYSAAGRIRDYYNPTTGMYGNQLGQLMYGVDYPATTVQGLDFNSDLGFGNLDFGVSNFDDSPIDVFSLQVTTATNTQTFVTADVKINYITSTPDNLDPGIYTNPNVSNISYNSLNNHYSYYETTSTTKIVTTGTKLNVYLETWGPLNTLTNTTTNVLLSSVRIDGTSTATALLLSPIGTGNSISVTIPKSYFSASAAFSRVVFRKENQNASILSTDIDTVIDGGSLVYDNALGYRPSDIILDGDAFVSPMTSFAPEEVIPGQVQESLGINVFTKSPQGSPVIVTQLAIIDTTSTDTIVSLNLTPPSTASVIVSYNSKYLIYGIDYSVDVINNTLTLYPQPTLSILSITVVGVGGINLLGSIALTSLLTNNVSIITGQPLANVGSIYLTVNGKTAIKDAASGLRYVTTASSKGVCVINLSGMDDETNLIQAWLFAPTYKAYSELKQQLIQVTTSTTDFNLVQIPGFLGPFEEQTIVEVNGLRINPPNTTYYQVDNSQSTFLIHPNETAPPGAYSLDQIKVFRNGIQLDNTVDFILDQPNKSIIFNTGFLSNGDVLAIETYLYSDYSINENTGVLTLVNPARAGDTINIITFTNGDASGIRTERFYATQSSLYKMERTIVNDNYVWVSVAGKPLLKDFDYSILADRSTIQISINYPYNINDKILVTSISDKLAVNIMGFKIFNDILGRTQVKRFSEQNTTFLTQDLLLTDKEIYVYDTSILFRPDPIQNKPGIIFINSERIEYMSLNNNVLGRIKRATLGTGALNFVPAGTPILDGSITQTVPTNNGALIQNIITTNTTTYTISTVTVNTNLSSGDGILINPNIISTNGLVDQVEVYYAGVLLRKTSSIYHDSELGYDTDENSSDTVIPAEFSITYNKNTNIASITLNLSQLRKLKLVQGGRLTLVQKVDKTWYSAGKQLSLLDDTTPQATFLQGRLSGLPDKYQYEST